MEKPLLGTFLHVHREEGKSLPDCLEIGTPGKGGMVKIHGDFADPQDFEKRIRTALALRDIAAGLMAGGSP